MSESTALAEAGRDLKARQAALAAAAKLAVTPTALIEYRSSGRVLIIGSYTAASAALQALAAGLSGYAVVTDGRGPGRTDMAYSDGKPLQLEGHLGDYRLTVGTGDAPVERFDLVLDLQETPLLTFELLPFGYFAPGPDPERLPGVLDELGELIGEFEKPKYFELDAAICAHGRSRLTGCTRCLETCPTGAITALADAVSVDPFYCQGGGSCATACPTGAISYRYPAPADTIDRLRTMLRAYRDAGGREPVLLIHDGEAGQQRLDEPGRPLPDNVIPVLVEELGSVGMDSWLAGLAFAARRVLLLDTPAVPASVRRELQAQLEVAQALLAGMGYPATAVTLLAPDADLAAALLAAADSMPALRPAGFAGSNEKRTMLYAAIDWLYGQAPRPQTRIELPSVAPFGQIMVDGQACTLCFACVSVCPAAALATGGTTPQLQFIEANCVQCGLCETACPEDAISRQQRLLGDREARRRSRTLHEEAPFCCIVCGTPFATRSVIARMTERLGGHWMFQDAKALRRLQMCGDCRVRDMFEDSG